MKSKNSFLELFRTPRMFMWLQIVLAFSTSTHALSDEYCKLVTKHIDSLSGTELVFFEDRSVRSIIPDINVSYAVFGQKPTQFDVRKKALEALLKDPELSVESIQAAHKELTHGKANLRFRNEDDAKALGFMSFKSYHLLTDEELASLSENPLLTFVSRKEVADVGGVADRWNIGDIQFPNSKNFMKFQGLLSLSALAQAKAGKLSNDNLLEDLVRQALTEAKSTLNAGKKPYEVLAQLEWRLKSLGLYYEQTYKEFKNYIESDFSKIDLNKSSEISELIVDAFAIQNKIVNKRTGGLARIYRPNLTDGLGTWINYMKLTLDGSAVETTKSLLLNLMKAEKKLPKVDQSLFETYYLTRVISGRRMVNANAESILKDFNAYKRRFHSNQLTQEKRATLIPLSYIRNFGSNKMNYSDYIQTYFLEDKTLYRGVSNPRAMSEDEFLEYFNSFKGRYSSELARSSFDDRVQLAKLAMIRYNADLIDGKLVDEALQHAAKHAGFEDPNSAKTYLTSMTEHDTVAFRFAVDLGYVDESSTTKAGTAHFVIETYWPKQGAVDFSSFKAVDENWKNYYPRQKETAVAGGIDPLSVKRLYVVEPYAANAKRPAVGPEKHGRIIQVFERDPKNPNRIWILKRDEHDEWVRDYSRTLN